MPLSLSTQNIWSLLLNLAVTIFEHVSIAFWEVPTQKEVTKVMAALVEAAAHTCAMQL